MRGAPDRSFICSSGSRIIPADAGSTIRQWEPACGSEDHPRGCGEHTPQERRIDYVGGSSPRMRGALSRLPKQREPFRIIPADAGSTYLGAEKYIRLWDHPRGCGEHISITPNEFRYMGSSPRMRGALTPG